jgi:hypothetical protein
MRKPKRKKTRKNRTRKIKMIPRMTTILTQPMTLKAIQSLK